MRNKVIKPINKAISYIKNIFMGISVGMELTSKGGMEVLALLFASRVITGRTKFSEIPGKLKEKVRQILIEEGLEDLCVED